MSNFPAQLFSPALKAALSLLVILVAAMLLLELGFILRSRVESLHINPVKSSGKIRVLFIGDSVLGFLKQPKSLSSQIALGLQSQGGQFEFRELSTPAQRTAEVTKQIEATLLEFQPQFIIMMVGKSDYAIEGLGQWGSLLRFRTARLLYAAYFDLKQQLLKVSDYNQYTAKAELRQAWKFVGQDNCEQAIPLFEKAIPQLMADESRDKIYRSLHLCYIERQNSAQAVHFFENLNETGTYKDLVRSFIEVHSLLLDPKSVPKFVQNKSRDQVRTSMWFYRKGKQLQAFHQEFFSMAPELSDRLNENSVNNLKYILSQSRRSKSTVFMLQYPLDYLSVLQSALGNSDPNLIYLDPRTWFKEASPEEFIQYWAEDIEHLSTAGITFLAKRIVESIGTQIRAKNE